MNLEFVMGLLDALRINRNAEEMCLIEQTFIGFKHKVNFSACCFHVNSRISTNNCRFLFNERSYKFWHEEYTYCIINVFYHMLKYNSIKILVARTYIEGKICWCSHQK